MSKARSTGNLNNAIQVSDTGAITFVSGSTTLLTVNTAGQLSGSTAVKSATTASYADSFTVAGTLTAQTLVVQTITSSVSQITGSTSFGTLLSNTHVFSGSVTMNPGGLFVSSSGNVGIGATAPLSKLSIGGNGYADRAITAIASGGDFAMTIQQNSTGAGLQVYSNNASWGNIPMQVQNNTGYQFIITAAGNVGIGTGSPTDKLTINGSVSSNSSISGVSFGVNNSVSIKAQTISSISGTYTTIGYSQTYANLFWVRWNDSGGTTDYALVGCIWYPGTVNVISSTNNGGHGVTFQMSGQYLQMRAASGTVGPVIAYQIGD